MAPSEEINSNKASTTLRRSSRQKKLSQQGLDSKKSEQAMDELWDVLPQTDKISQYIVN